MRIIIMCVFTVVSLFSMDLKAKFDIAYGIFGTVGTTTTQTYVDEQNHYRIDLHVETQGLAHFFSGSREEWYLSVGNVNIKGVFIPESFEKKVTHTVSTGSASDVSWEVETVTQKYTFDHEKKKIMLEETKARGEKILDKVKKQLDYYAPYDLLSLFLNFPKVLPSLDLQKPTVLYAVGANDKDGRVDVHPVENALSTKDKFGWSDGHILKVILNQKIFASEKGELLLNLGDDGLAKNGVLQDVIFFGDIRGTRVF